MTWSTVADLTQQDGDSSMIHGLFPVVGYGTDNKVSVAWFAADANKRSVYLMIESDDNASAFSSPILLSQDTTDYSTAIADDFYGDYFNLVRVGCRTIVAWADGRDNLGPKMYVGRIDHCAPLTGISQSPLGRGWSVSNPWPNPVKDQMSMTLDAEQAGDWEVSLVGVDGKKLGQLMQKSLPAGKHRLELRLPAVPSGSYWIHVSNGDGVATRPIFIE
jgi:hypothetical protein